MHKLRWVVGLAALSVSPAAVHAGGFSESRGGYMETVDGIGQAQLKVMEMSLAAGKVMLANTELFGGESAERAEVAQSTTPPDDTREAANEPAQTQNSSENTPSPTRVPEKIIYAGSKDMPCKPGEKISKVATTKPQVALTIDDGPSPATTREILRVFEETDTVGTFFYVTNRMETGQGKSLVKETLAGGHQVAAHSHQHYLRNPNGNAADHGRSSNVFEKTIGGNPYAYRAPALAYSQPLVEAVAAAGQCFIGVSENADTNDWKSDFEPYPTAMKNLKSRDDHVIEHLTPGAIILAHDEMQDLQVDGGKHRRRETAAEHIRYLIQGIKDKGYELVTVDTLLKDASD